MPVQLNPAGDLAVMDAQQTVSYTSTSGDGADAAALTGLTAIVRAMDLRGTQPINGLVLEPDDRAFHIAAAAFGATTPKEGDKITDSGGTVWRVIHASYATIQSRWRLFARKA